MSILYHLGTKDSLNNVEVHKPLRRALGYKTQNKSVMDHTYKANNILTMNKIL